jgi:DNA-binding transcriptional LysR family regulator
LLDKENGKYTLTYAGEQLYKRVTKILSEVDRIKTISIDNNQRQTIHMEGHDYHLYKYAINACKKVSNDYPNLDLKLSGSTNKLTINQLLKKKTDIGIVAGNITSSDLVSKIIGYETVVLCIHANNYCESLSLADYLERYPIIIDQSEYYNFDNLFEQSLSRPFIIDTNSDEVAQEGVLSGNMLGIMRSGRLQKDIELGNVAVIKELIPREPINLVMNKSSESDKYIQATFEAIALECCV